MSLFFIIAAPPWYFGVLFRPAWEPRFVDSSPTFGNIPPWAQCLKTLEGLQYDVPTARKKSGRCSIVDERDVLPPNAVEKLFSTFHFVLFCLPCLPDVQSPWSCYLISPDRNFIPLSQTVLPIKIYSPSLKILNRLCEL